MEFDIDSILRDYFAKEDRERHVGVYYPSELGFCIRRNWYLYKYPRPVDDATKKVVAVGKIFHEFIFKALESKKFNVHENEKSLSIIDGENGLVISGRIDHLIKVDNDSEPFIIEVKTSKSVKSLKEAKREHKMQIMPYMIALQVKKAMIIYVEKDNLDTKSFEFEFDDELFKDMMQRARRLHNCLTTNVFPPAEAKEDMSVGWMCLYCQYRDMCR